MIEAQYTMSILLIAAGSVFILLHEIKSKKVKVIIILSALFMALFGKVIFSEIAFLLSTVVDQRVLGPRLIELGNMVAGNYEKGSDVSLRFQLYRQSLDVFLRFPVFGCGNIYDGIIGEHSTMLDTMGMFGIVGAGAFYVGIYNIFHAVSSKVLKCSELIKVYSSIIILFFILSLVNTTNNDAFYLFLIIVIPVIILETKGKKV